jgi:serine/threonine protein kinase
MEIEICAIMVLAPRTRLGPYEILSVLGVGGMGEVYRARDTRLERTVAIKILSQLSDDPVNRQRFEREARAISSLNHPNICTLHDIGQQDGIDYLVMECVEGETLAKSPSGLYHSLCKAVMRGARALRILQNIRGGPNNLYRLASSNGGPFKARSRSIASDCK